MATAFDKQVTAWARKSELRLTQTYRQSVQDLVEEAQEPRGSGGNMPVDTGFLRSSGDAALDRLPVVPSEPTEGAAPVWDAQSALLTIAQAQLGQTVYFGWGAKYSTFMEERYGFVRLAAQRWPQIVNAAARKLEQRVRR